MLKDLTVSLKQVVNCGILNFDLNQSKMSQVIFYDIWRFRNVDHNLTSGLILYFQEDKPHNIYMPHLVKYQL